MAASLTKYGISEQILRLIKGSDNPAASSLRMPEIQLLVGQAVNKLIKAEAYSAMAEPEGSIPPNGLVIATYENVSVSTYKTNYSKITLPCVPVRLPKNMGVFHISKSNDPFNPFIPIPSGLFTMVQSEPLISDILGQVGYEVYGSDVVFTKDLLSQSPAVEDVLVRLVVCDVSVLSDTDPLPVPADFEILIIEEVLTILGIQRKADNKVDAVSETK